MRISQKSKMADEDDFVALGTPFEQLEDDAPRKKPVPLHEQIVTDDRGRRRFHGAFTGGFSAGYFNTVDTKEGWTPKTFISSRSQKATERVTQRPEDFMDEEDLSEFGIAPKRVVTTQKFLPSRSDDSTSSKRGHDGASSGTGSAALGASLLQDIIVPVKMSVGIKLLSQMGWKEGQGVGPRVRREAKKTYGCAGPPGAGPDKPEDEEDVYAVGLFFAPKDVESFEFASKDDLHGIGYSGIDPKTALLSQRDWLGMNPSASSIGIRGQGFGVGALEEDDEDVYAQDNLSKYDIELSTSKPQSRNDLHGWSGPQQTSGLGGMLSIFCKASQPPPARKHYPPPIIPRDFKPFHKPEEAAQTKQPLPGVPGNQKTQETNQAGKRLTAKERGEALGEVPLPTPKKSIFDYIAEEDKTRLKESKDEANTSKGRAKPHENSDLERRFASRGPLSTSGFKPFVKDPEKQARYEQYVSGKNEKDMPSQTDSKMTEWERECEMEEFARAAALYRPLSQTMAARFTSAKDTDEKQNEEDSGKKDQTTAAKMKMFGALTRERFEWHPDRVLCKRLNIPHPYPGSGVTGVVMKRRESSKAEKVVREVKAIDYKPHSSQPDRDEGKSTEHQDETEMVQKSSALVAGFQSIVTQQKLKQPSNQDTSAGTSAERSDKEDLKKTEQNTESDANVIKRASMDLFNEIFAESSSESESESEENEEVKESKTVELDVEVSQEKIEAKEALPINDIPVQHAQEERTPGETFEQEKEPSPETFGPALPSSFSGNTANSSRGSYLSTLDNSPKRQEKQKRKKKKKRKDKDTGSDSDSDDGYRRRRKEKKKRAKKKASDISDSDEEYTSKTRKKKKRTNNSESDLSDSDEKDIRKKKKEASAKYKNRDSSHSESEETSRRRKKKARSKHSDSEDKYDKRKKKTRPKDDSDENQSSDDESTKHMKKKRKDKEKSPKERKKHSVKTKRFDQQEYEEIQYSEEYIERNALNTLDGESSKSFESPEGSRSRTSNHLEKSKESRNEISEKDTRKSTDRRTDKDSSKEQDVSRVPDNKEIIDKLKNIQMLKERKRMRAADFM